MGLDVSAMGRDVPLAETHKLAMTINIAVLGIDMQAHTLRVVSPQGGEVHTFAVTSPEGRRLMAQLKPGDKITAYVTESMLIAVERG